RPAYSEASRRMFAVLFPRGRLALAMLATLLVACVVLENCGLAGLAPAGVGTTGQSATPGVAFHRQGGVTIYSVTPQGGPPPPATPEVNPGGPMVLTPPVPAFFLEGNLYRNSDVYRADTGLPA